MLTFNKLINVHNMTFMNKGPAIHLQAASLLVPLYRFHILIIQATPLFIVVFVLFVLSCKVLQYKKFCLEFFMLISY